MSYKNSDYHFFSMGNKLSQKIVRDGQKFLYYSTTFIDTEKNIHKRQVYSIFDLMGDMGGVLDALITIFGLFIFPAKK